jgi:rod shape determining protein RodA
MSFLEYRVKTAPTGLRKVLYLNWPLVVLVTAVASVGFPDAVFHRRRRFRHWARPQMERFGAGWW